MRRTSATIPDADGELKRPEVAGRCARRFGGVWADGFGGLRRRGITTTRFRGGLLRHTAQMMTSAAAICTAYPAVKP